MIIRETEHNFIMISQQDHARFSGDVAIHLKKQFSINDPHYQDALVAVYEHDRSWIRLDETPIWNDKKSVPYSFDDYPLLPKVIMYQRGLDEVEAINEYAGLICSLHYSLFKAFQNTKQIDCQQFYSHELQRQERIKQKLNLTDNENIVKHFRLLRLCDDISLYVCLNHPGSNKVSEHPWFHEGFPHSERFNVEDGSQPLAASWLNNQVIRIHPSPFENDFSAKLKLKRVSKELVRNSGIADAYKITKWEEQRCDFEAK
jgi:hypothetical protein